MLLDCERVPLTLTAVYPNVSLPMSNRGFPECQRQWSSPDSQRVGFIYRPLWNCLGDDAFDGTAQSKPVLWNIQVQNTAVASIQILGLCQERGELEETSSHIQYIRDGCGTDTATRSICQYQYQSDTFYFSISILLSSMVLDRVITQTYPNKATLAFWHWIFLLTTLLLSTIYINIYHRNTQHCDGAA